MNSLLRLSIFTILVVAITFAYTQASYAGIGQVPPLWTDDFGDELTDLSGQDDAEQMVTLPFAFPYNGNTYTTAYVGTNGCIQFEGLGQDGTIAFNYYRNMNEFLADSDPDNPIFCPINTDFDLDNEGAAIFYNDSNDPLVFTWNNIPSIGSEEDLSTFQMLLYSNGSIVFNYNGIAPGADLGTFENGIVVGITPSDFTWDGQPFVPGDPGPNDLNAGTVFYDRTTIYERWCLSENSCGTTGNPNTLPGPPVNDFDLDFQSICFLSQEDGFEVSSAGPDDQFFQCRPLEPRQVPTLSEWGLLAMAGILGLFGYIAIRKKAIA